MNRYQFAVPCQKVWFVYVEAATENAAWEKIRERNYIFMYELEGNTPTGKTELVNVHELDKGESNG